MIEFRSSDGTWSVLGAALQSLIGSEEKSY